MRKRLLRPKLVFGGFLAALAGVLAWAIPVVFAPKPGPPPLVPPSSPLPPGEYPQGALSIGDKTPKLQAEGWLNGPPPTAGDQRVKLMVIDIWAFW